MQDQPVPDMDVAVRPLGKVSVTVTVPVVEADPLLLTVIVYVAPVCPCVKLPVWVFVIARSGTAIVAVGSLTVSFEVLFSPPPETIAVLVTTVGALVATLTVRVIAG